MKRNCRVLGVGCLVAGLALLPAGCYGLYHDLVDPCYPERYNCKAREEVTAPRVIQARNGLILEQTLYNTYFAEGSDKLLPNGQALLARLARRRPAPEPEVFIQTAHDLTYTPDKPEQYATARRELNDRRKKAVEEFLRMERPDVPFVVYVHDPGRIGIDSREAATATQQMYYSAVGVFYAGGAAGATGASTVGGTSTGVATGGGR